MNRPQFPLFCMILLAGASFGFGQTPSGTSKPGTPSSPPAAPRQSATPGSASSLPKTSSDDPGSLLPAETAVLTINGVCEVTPTGTPKAAARTGAAKTASTNANGSSASAGNCKTQITRAEFDKLLKTISPSAPAASRRQIANSYVQLLTAANEGIKMGVDKEPEFPEQLALMRLQILAQDSLRKLRTEASTVSDADAKKYYDENLPAFEEVTLTRVFVPRSATPTAPGQQPSATDSEAIAKSAREQLAAAGSDPDKIEKSVYEQLKTTSEPPTTKFGSRRRGSLPPAHEQKVFAAKVGEVTDIIPDSVGYVMYRVDAKQQLPFDQVKDDTKRRITQQRLQDIQQQLTSSSKADYNDAYFGPETPAVAPRAPASTPPATSAPQPQQSQPTTPKQ